MTKDYSDLYRDIAKIDFHSFILAQVLRTYDLMAFVKLNAHEPDLLNFYPTLREVDNTCVHHNVKFQTIESRNLIMRNRHDIKKTVSFMTNYEVSNPNHVKYLTPKFISGAPAFLLIDQFMMAFCPPEVAMEYVERAGRTSLSFNIPRERLVYFTPTTLAKRKETVNSDFLFMAMKYDWFTPPEIA